MDTALAAGIDPYCAKLAGFDPETVKDVRRRLRNVGKLLWRLRQAPAGELRTANTHPKEITGADVAALIQAWKVQGLETSYQVKLLEALDGYLCFFGNPVITNLRKMRTIKFPKPVEKPIRVLRKDEVERLHAAAEAMDGWEGCVARFLLAYMLGTGVRPTEFRTQDYEGFDPVAWQVLVTHPKGEGVWSSPDYAPFIAPSRQAALDYFEERKAYLGDDEHPALVPWRHPDWRIDYLGQKILMGVKKGLQELSGVKFELKQLRATFAQTLKDLGAPIEVVSKALRHKSTKTTERYYARLRTDKAFEAIDALFQTPVVPSRKS